MVLVKHLIVYHKIINLKQVQVNITLVWLDQKINIFARVCVLFTHSQLLCLHRFLEVLHFNRLAMKNLKLNSIFFTSKQYQRCARCSYSQLLGLLLLQCNIRCFQNSIKIMKMHHSTFVFHNCEQSYKFYNTYERN